MSHKKYISRYVGTHKDHFYRFVEYFFIASVKIIARILIIERECASFGRIKPLNVILVISITFCVGVKIFIE